jgi:hypothetical protein
MHHSLVFVKEARIDSHVLFYPLAHLNAEAELLEQVAQSVPVDQLDGRGTDAAAAQSSITPANSVPGAAVLVFRDPDNLQLELFAEPSP